MTPSSLYTLRNIADIASYVTVGVQVLMSLNNKLLCCLVFLPLTFLFDSISSSVNIIIVKI